MSNVIQLVNPVTHNGKHYNRGIYTPGKNIDPKLAEFFVTKFPWAAHIYKPDAAYTEGIVETAPDNFVLDDTGTVETIETADVFEAAK